MSETVTSLDTLITRFGVEETIQMIEFSQPFVSQWEQQLHEALLVGDWESAANCAHKAISSVRLYGSPKLETLLCQIRDGGSGMNFVEIQQALSAEFASVTETVNAWVATQKSAT